MAASVQVRKDPRPRNPNGEVRGVRLLNKDATKYYVFVNPADQDTYGYYEALGYQVEKATDAGVKLSLRTTKPGENITYQGQILMSLDLDARKDIEKNGDGDNEGLQYAKRLEGHIVDKNKVQKDLMRGFDGRYTRAESEIGQLSRES